MKYIPWLLLCATLSAQTVSRTHASFLDGTGLEIVTKTTGSSSIDANGSVGLGEGIPEHSAFRIVTDSKENMLFGYSVTASRSTVPGAVAIRIFPLDVSKIADGFDILHAPRGPVPTVSGIRDFPTVKIGEVVELDILSNPSTGEKIYDVLRPYISTPPENMQVSAVKVPDTISLRQIAMRVNGRAVPTAPSWIVGAAIRIEVPEHGAWVLSTYEPPAASGRNFERIAQVNGQTLSWKIGANRIEITSETPILSQSAQSIWVCEDHVSKASLKADSPRFQAADTVEPLLAERNDKK
jgi:hypothetical protein